MTGPLVSLIVPVLRDTDELTALLDALLVPASTDLRDPQTGYEVIVVNGADDDLTLEAVRHIYPTVRWLSASPGRGRQMNAGARQARGQWLLFLHADTCPGPGWLDEIREVCTDPQVCGGAFRFTLRSPSAAARIVERTVSWRVRWLGLPYGDQGLLVKRDVFEQLGGYRLLPLMEDVDLVRRVRRVGRLVSLDSPIAVSARRYEREGWGSRTARNLALLGLYWCGVSPRRLARAYYRRPKDRIAPGGGVRAFELPPRPPVAVIMPALNEAEAIGRALEEVPRGVDAVVVVDNGSTDETAMIARNHGATVVREPRRGYGRACLAGLRAVPSAEVIVFLDADCSDYPADLTTLVEPILAQEADLVMGCRDGVGRPPAARIGTAVCVTLINWLWRTAYEDLGPFRAIRRQALDRLDMSDQTYGWTIEMQVKAAEANLRVLEIPIAQRPRVGRSKISGTLGGTVRAGTRMLITIWTLWRTRGARDA